MSSMDGLGGAPLLNDYKLDFFWKRFPQTVLGGPKLRLGYDAPLYVYLHQILNFLFPFILGGLFTILAELNVMSAPNSGYAYGSLILVCVLALQLLSWFIRQQSANTAKLQSGNVLAEDDEIDFVSCFSVETVEFVLPGKKFAVNMVLHALISGALCGLMFLYILPSNLNDLFSNTGATVILFILGWWTVCTAQYSLTSAPPPEPATFRALDSQGIYTPLMRPFYTVIFGLIGVLSSKYEELMPINKILHIVFPFLPLLWIVGILPPLDALFSWLAEQGLVLILGGSPQATDMRLLIMFLVSSIVVVMVTFISSHLATVIIAGCFGYLLSCDVFGLARQIWRNKLTSKGSSVLHGWSIKDLVIHAAMLVFCVTVVGLSFHLSGTESSKVLFDAFGFVFIALVILIKCTGDVQGVYVVFGLLRNPLYPASIENLESFKTRKRLLKHTGFVRHLLLAYVSPLCLVAFFGLFLAPDKLTSLSSFAVAIGTVRAMRQAWQNTFNCLLEVVLVYLCAVVLGTEAAAWWTSAGLGLQLMLVGVCRNRIQQLFSKLSFMATLTVTSWSQRKQRHRLTVPVLVLSAVFFPVVLGIVGSATLLSAPLLPLFCLPVFLIGFPRPLRSWPLAASTAASVCPDTVYYRQLTPQLISALGVIMATGAAGSPHPGDHFLARFQDRMIWVHVLECGYRFSTVVIKGLELQETSCHTVEAARVDDVFEGAFTREGKWPIVSVNPNAGNVLRPCDAVILSVYSDANNVLTGVIDQPDNLRKNSENFWKTLLWVLIHHSKRGQLGEAEGETVVSVLEKKEESDTKPTGAVQRIQSRDDMELIVVTKHEPRTEPNQVKPVETATIRRRTSSLPSLSDSVWSQESLDLSGSHDKEGELNLAGFPAVHKRVQEDEDSFELGGFPALDIGKTPVSLDVGNSSGFASTSDPSGYRRGIPGGSADVKRSNANHNARTVSIAFSSKYARLIDLPAKWRDCHAVVDRQHVDAVSAQFPEAWYKHVLSLLEFDTEGITEELASDQALAGLYRQLVSVCYVLVEVLGFPGSSSVQAGPGHVFKVYSGDLPWSRCIDWLEKDVELRSLVIKAYRYAFKLTYDEAVLGEVTSLDELADYMQQYDRDWYMGSDQDDEWQQAVMEGKPALFCIGKDKDKGNYTSRVLTKQSIVTPLGRLNGECVRAQWASLALELLYFTNDDEERYSIQAHPTLLRNLSIQAADPPLGYPVYSSGAVSVAVHVTPL